MTYRTLRLCSGRGAFEAVPEPKLELDLAAIAARLRERGVPVTDARVLLLATFECESTIAKDGRILFKTDDPLVAARALVALRDAAGLPAEPTEAAAPPRSPARLMPP